MTAGHRPHTPFPRWVNALGLEPRIFRTLAEEIARSNLAMTGRFVELARRLYIGVMDIELDMPPELLARVDALAARTGATRSRIIRDALERGWSVAWQEEWLRRVEEGLEAADKGEFAADSDVEAAFDRHRPR